MTEGLKTPSMRLDGLTAAVTGAGRGIGRAAALALAQAGARVVPISRTLADLEEVAETIRADGGAAEPAVCDVTDTAAVSSVVAGLDRLDILVNNAGCNIPEPFLDVTEAHYDTIMNLNLKAVFMVGQAAARKMVEGGGGGAIINISSQLGHVGAPNRTVYASSKHAVEGLTRSMALDLAQHRIRVNSIGPTFILTPMTAPFFENKDFYDDTIARIPLGRLGNLEDVMGAVVFLASPAAALITGSALVVDGGWNAW
ncbi:MAG: SDR family oxidoreductase [Defluviicoccus sp.]|nr:SDR family oxidoreductase [Defluviicoccus sp.]MDE0276332.1 SDR family oxidoreductase [Defluviicoccus sp.]